MDDLVRGGRASGLLQGQAFTYSSRLSLADTPPFRIGELHVIPATRQVMRGSASELLEPRVMQVLVALARADGRVLSRDQLIDLCWGGVIVGENAIQRVISRIRHIAAAIGKDCFQLETITKVGYRMIVSPQTERRPVLVDLPVERRAPTRRLFIAGAVAAAVAGIGLYGRQVSPNPEDLAAAETYYQNGLAIREENTPTSTQQALAYFREAVRLAPGMAKAWGGLAYGYANAAYWSDSDKWAAAAERCRSAAEHALRLDPNDPDALCALVFVQPLYRNWLRVEPLLSRVLGAHRLHRRANGLMAQLLGDVGRWHDAIPHYRVITGPDGFIAIARYGLIHALWNAGQLEEAQSALDAATARWPNDPDIWEARVKFLAFTGRPDEALSLLSDASGHATGPATYVDELAKTIRAVARASTDEKHRAAQAWLRRISHNPDEGRFAVEYLSALGALDEAFAVASGCYLARGPWAKLALPQHRFEGWITAPLLGVLAAPMRLDTRFPALVQQIGLESYWRTSRTTPDYRGL